MSEEAIQYLKEIKDLLEHKDDITILYAKDVAKILGISINKATELWHREDFPGINIGFKKVEKKAFNQWLQTRKD